MSVPEQHECDQNNPRDAFVWALVGLPAGKTHVPLMVHPDTMAEWSKHLHDLGFRHHREHQKKEWHPPHRGLNSMMNGAGRWLPAGTPRLPQITAPDMSLLTQDERAHVVKQLHEAGHLDEVLGAAVRQSAATHTASVSSWTPTPQDAPEPTDAPAGDLG